ncbi:MAG: hypothetical protein JXR41_00940, partial [Bacteroidales bacterium]|nr:hypothetical protein [Bacteroidales bacterium]
KLQKLQDKSKCPNGTAAAFLLWAGVTAGDFSSGFHSGNNINLGGINITLAFQCWFFRKIPVNGRQY